MTDNIDATQYKTYYYVVNSNFTEKYPEIEKKMKSAAVISIDSEFSGMAINTGKHQHSLFDDGAIRYSKLRENVRDYIILQFGLTAFCFNRDDNKYEAHMYNFFVFPRAFSTLDPKFSCLSSSLEFLSRNSFDFNKVIYEGISYLNDEQEKCLTKELKDGSLFQQTNRNISMENESVLNEVLNELSAWLHDAKTGETLTLEKEAIKGNNSKILSYLIHKEIRNRFSNVWTTPSVISNKIVVTKVDPKERAMFQAMGADSLEKYLIDYFLGFTKIFRLLVSLKKPIVGHNLILDLLIMYSQFYQPLPSSYRTFKKSITTLFPKLFDTKFISYELKRVLKKEDAWVSNAVLDLYKYFITGKGREATLYRPDVKLWFHDVENVNFDVVLHEAGWDSYICGYCFVQMGHFFASYNYGPDGYKRPLSSTEHINGLGQFMNKVNLVRASIPYICFSAADPPSGRPQVLIIQMKGNKKINLVEVASMLAKFCSVDVKPYTSTSALIATSTYSGARNILQELSNDKYKVSIFHPIKDSEYVKVALWSTLVLSTGVYIGALYHRFWRH